MLRDRVMPTSDGRTLAVAEWGDPAGLPVINCHGTPGSRLGRQPDEVMYDRLGVHMVTYDRPGYGASDRKVGRRVVDAVPDIVAVADALGFDRFVVGGGSGGAPHALACAALLGERILATYAVVPVAPFEALGKDLWMAGQAPSNVDEFSAAFAGPQALMAYLCGEVEKMREDELAIFGAEELSGAERDVMARESVQRVLREALAESIRQGPGGWFDDDLAFITYPWGFDLAAISGPVVLAYGEDDNLAPRAHGEYLAGAIPGVEVRTMPSGHLTAVDHAEANWTRVLELASGRP